MITFSFFQVMLISGLINALILFFSLSRMKPRYRQPALYLGLFVVGYLLYHVDLHVRPDIQSTVTFIIPHLPILYFMPALLFFFVSSVFFPEEKLPGRYRWLLVPGLLDIAYSVFGWSWVQWNQSGTVYDIITGPVGFFAYEGGALLFSALVLGMLIVRLYRLKNVRTETFRFFRYILAGVAIILLRWLAFFVVDVGFPSVDADALQTPFWIFEAAFLIYVGYKVLNAPKVLNASYSGYEAPEGEALREETARLKEVVEGEKLYLDPGLSRKQLAVRMDCSEVHISAVIGEGLGTTFYGYINRLRAEEARRMIDENRLESFTVEGLTREAGFKSKSTFYKAFREQTGMTPSDYADRNQPS